MSAYQTIQNLAEIATLPAHPATRVRLRKETAREIGGHLDEWAAKLRRAGELGEFTLGPEDTAWFKASITSEDEAVTVYQRVVDLLRKLRDGLFCERIFGPSKDWECHCGKYKKSPLQRRCLRPLWCRGNKGRVSAVSVWVILTLPLRCLTSGILKEFRAVWD